MRTVWLALLLCLAACGRGGADNEEAGANAVPGVEPGVPEASATITLAGGGGDCAARWDGQPATREQVTQRSVALLDRAISAAGSVANITEEQLPSVAVVAPAGLGFACADTFLAAVNRAGIPTVLLRVEGSQERPEAAAFTLTEIAVAPSVVVAVGAGGRTTWNDEAVDTNQLAERARAMGGGPNEEAVRPGELELRPVREASFGQVYEALRTIREGNVRAALLLPSVPPRPRATAPPAGPPPSLNEIAPVER